MTSIAFFINVLYYYQYIFITHDIQKNTQVKNYHNHFPTHVGPCGLLRSRAICFFAGHPIALLYLFLLVNME
jgi:hypothetical protein